MADLLFPNWQQDYDKANAEISDPNSAGKRMLEDLQRTIQTLIDVIKDHEERISDLEPPT